LDCTPVQLKRPEKSILRSAGASLFRLALAVLRIILNSVLPSSFAIVSDVSGAIRPLYVSSESAVSISV